jgi:O-succinylbenzoic acid--CoA ligase
MPAADETEVVATTLAGNALAQAVERCWDEGRAVLPIDPRLPAAEQQRLLEQLRPTHFDDGTERTTLDHGVPAATDVAAIVVTSGTTATPKGVELTAAGRDAMGRAYSAGVGATTNDNWLACLPLHHVASLGVIARSYITGVPYTVHDRFDIERVAASPRAEGTTIVSVVPTALYRLLEANAPVDEFRCIIVGGAPCPPGLRARAEANGATIVDAYGCTETWSGFVLNGVPIEGAHVELRGPEDEVVVRGPMVMRGYRLDPARTNEVLEPDGSWHTGDVGAYDGAGRLRVVDRLKDLVITGGVNVSPTEIEGVLERHPNVEDVCVIGVPDDEWGERVVAYVVARDTAPTVDELRAFAREQLATPKLPREVRIVDAIPRSGSGKPLRRVLREHP